MINRKAKVRHIFDENIVLCESVERYKDRINYISFVDSGNTIELYREFYKEGTNGTVYYITFICKKGVTRHCEIIKGPLCMWFLPACENYKSAPEIMRRYVELICENWYKKNALSV